MLENFVPDIYAKSVFLINYKKLKKSGIKCILFDLDNTLAPNSVKKPSKKLIDLFEELKDLGFKIIILSNAPKNRIEPFKNTLNVDAAAFALKPKKDRYLKIMKTFNYKPEDICAVGDQLVTDVYGANKMCITSVLVNPMSPKDFFTTTFMRFFERKIMKVLGKRIYLRKEDIMTRKCSGCGLTLQSDFPKKDGYIREDKISTSSICERCFKIKNYGEYTVVTKKIDFKKIVNKINKDKSLVVFLIDILNINYEIIDYIKMFNNEVFIILTKRDIIPKSVKDKKIIEYFKDNFYNTENIICVSSFKNKNIDNVVSKINEVNYKNIYVVGLTNSGKSTFINALMKSCKKMTDVTTSALPNTTIDFIEMKFDDKLIIDTPGFVMENSIYNYIPFKEVKKITPLKELKVKTFQMKSEETVIVDNLVRIDNLSNHKNSFSFYMSNSLKYNRMKIKTRDDLKALPKKNIHLNGEEDIVINGLGFIKVTKECDVVVYTLDENLISVRKSMI